MRILQLTNKTPWPPTDGGAIATLNLSKGFFLLGNPVTILAMNTEKHFTRLEDIPEHLAAQIRFKLVDVPARITFLGAMGNLLFSDLPYNATRFISEDYSKALIELLKEEEFDVIQLEGLYMCPYIPLIRKHSKALIAYRAHNIEYEIWERAQKVASGFQRFYLNLLAKRIKQFGMSYLNTYDVVVAITDRDGEHLDRLGNIKPRTTSQTSYNFV